MTGIEIVRSEMACACRLADIRDVDDLLGHAERLFDAFWSAPMVAGGESPAWSECSARTVRRWVAVARRRIDDLVCGSPSADGRSRIAHDLRDAGFTSASWQGGPERQAIDAALAVVLRFGGIDGEHHKTWVLDQVVRALTGDGYAEWVRAAQDGPDTYPWDVGIPP